MTTEKIYNFMGLRKVAAAFSITLLLISVASLAINGLKFGLDFTGGSLIEAKATLLRPSATPLP